MFTTTPLCAICNPWVQNATGYASQSVCINSNNDFGMPSKTYDCYCQPIGPCQEREKTEGYITISALISASFSWFQLISVGIESESAGINQIGSYRLESACISTCQCELKKKKKRRIHALEKHCREFSAGATPILPRWCFREQNLVSMVH